MARVLSPEDLYRGKRGSARQLNTTLDNDAFNLLAEFCPPGRKNTGQFLARLLYEHKARVETQREMQADAVNGGREAVRT